MIIPMKISLCLFFVPLWAFSFGQDALPCGVDNLSCPRTDPDNQPRLCFTMAQLCEGSQLCSGGQDEGDNLAALNCKKSLFKALINCNYSDSYVHLSGVLLVETL